MGGKRAEEYVGEVKCELAEDAAECETVGKVREAYVPDFAKHFFHLLTYEVVGSPYADLDLCYDPVTGCLLVVHLQCVL